MITEPSPALRAHIAHAGWASTEVVLPPDDVDAIVADLQPAFTTAVGRGGVRNLLASDHTVQRLARVGPLRDLATAILGPESGAVRALLFDKTPETNWKVVWHQDLSIAVDRHRPAPGYGPWSEKEGVTHVQPPAHILEQMLAVRLHLDDCTSDNGPVRVLPGSHRAGKLRPAAITEWRARGTEVECCVPRGAVLLFRPLLLHASSPAQRPGHRRVLHLEFGPPAPGADLRWHTWVGLVGAAA